MAQHLLEHMTNKKSITIPILREIHGHIGDLDNQLSILHKATEDASFIWRRLTRVMGMPAKGSFIYFFESEFYTYICSHTSEFVRRYTYIHIDTYIYIFRYMNTNIYIYICMNI
jgi:hypothetical protein